MASEGFAFGFSGEDIEDDELVDDEMEVDNKGEELKMASRDQDAKKNDGAELVPPQTHKLDVLLAKLPSRIAFNTIQIEAPRGRKLCLPRRELFDIKAQMMAEDEDPASTTSSTSSTTLRLNAGLAKSDIETNIYEGGFKTWECSIDLAKLVLDRGPRKDLDDICRVDSVVELGCGTALPSLILFHYAITERLPMYFTFTDYNDSVLELVTLPNLLLTFASTLMATDAPFSEKHPNPLHDLSTSTPAGDLEVTPALISHFTETLLNIAMHLTFISGSWSPASPFLSQIPSTPEMRTFVLASETIYSPTAMSTFTHALIGILKKVKVGKGIVAAKRVYFGVGGGSDQFKRECAELGAVVSDVENHGVDLGNKIGVRRCLLEVQML